MNRIILSLLSVTFALLIAGDLKAQQDPYTTHYAFNRMAYNPAVAGSLKRFCDSVPKPQFKGFFISPSKKSFIPKFTTGSYAKRVGK